MVGPRTPITGHSIKKTSLKPKSARRIIRRYHQLLKLKNNAKSSSEIEVIQAEIDQLGGLSTYQEASLSGQSFNRGGDSSHVLVAWLKALEWERGRSILEVGCLHVDNACSKSGYFDRSRHVRIDLNSQHPDIEQQDFMDRQPTEQFDCVSLSLVVNFVATPRDRGLMLSHARKFLEPQGLLFFVLPSPCVTNSRYFTAEVFKDLCDSIGFKIVKYKITSKLVYWLLERSDKGSGKQVSKKLLNDGPNRNNFSMTWP